MVYSNLLKQSHFLLGWTAGCLWADAQFSFLLAVPRSNIAPYKMTILPQAVLGERLSAQEPSLRAVVAVAGSQDQRVQRAPKYAELMNLMQNEVRRSWWNCSG